MVTIYVIKISGSKWVYVGATQNFERRQRTHRGQLRARKHGNQILQKAFDSSKGVSALTFEVLKQVSLRDSPYEECLQMNRMAKIYDVANLRPAQRLRTNKRIPGLGIGRWTEEAKKRRSEQFKGHKGRKLTSEQADYMNSFPKPEYTAERRKQIADLGRSWGRAVRNKTTGEIFASSADAARFYNCSQSTIYGACSGRLVLAKKCEWEFHAKPLPPRK